MVLAIVLHLLWVTTLFCAGFGVGWLLVTGVEEMRLPIFAAVGLAALYLVIITIVGRQVGAGIEGLTGF